jgi:hypothetical protein
MNNDDKPARSAEELYLKYLYLHPRDISDLIFVMEVRKEIANVGAQYQPSGCID